MAAKTVPTASRCPAQIPPLEVLLSSQVNVANGAIPASVAARSGVVPLRHVKVRRVDTYGRFKRAASKLAQIIASAMATFPVSNPCRSA